MQGMYRLSGHGLGLALLWILLIITANGQPKKPKKPSPTQQLCGSDNKNKNVIDLTDPDKPGPFHDLTRIELTKLREFLERDPSIKVTKLEQPDVNNTYIHSADVLLPPKAEVLTYLDKPGAQQPIRKARVIVARGDQTPAVMEEYVCSPLPDVKECKLLQLAYRRNPVEYAFRPTSGVDYIAIQTYIFSEVDRKVGHILRESYGATFTDCEQTRCLSFQPSPLGSGLIKQNKRLAWYTAAYDLPYASLHILNFAILVDSTSAQPRDWSVVMLWYGDKLYDSYQSLNNSYNNGKIKKTKITPPVDDENLFSSLRRRGKAVPPNPQRPPTLVEPDGKRYSVKGRQVKYLDWTFNFRLSPHTGPGIYDVKFQGQRIAYEVALSEMAVFYSGQTPPMQTTNYVDSSELLGINSRALVPGGDCPETATLINSAFMSYSKREPEVYNASMCLFEHNNGYPLRRHLAYRLFERSFYGGMLDYVLTLRTAITIGNYDYIIDYIFHNNGVVETKFMSTGYIQTIFYATDDRPYGFRIHDRILGNVHFHMCHFKVDLDVGGTSNRYETLDITEESLPTKVYPDKMYSQTKIRASLKRTEMEAIYNFDFNTPKYHVVHNAAVRTDRDEIKGYRIQMNGMSRNLVDPDCGNEKTIPWARHQMVVTRQKDGEISSSSNYGMHDSLRPVVDFTRFYKDNETIVDQDLVFWISMGLHHIPRSEDLPVTTTVGNQLIFFLLPFNNFPECPSMGSRDAIYVELKNHKNSTLGVKVERNGNPVDECVIPKSNLEEDLARNPDQVLET